MTRLRMTIAALILTATSLLAVTAPAQAAACPTGYPPPAVEARFYLEGIPNAPHPYLVLLILRADNGHKLVRVVNQGSSAVPVAVSVHELRTRWTRIEFGTVTIAAHGEWCSRITNARGIQGDGQYNNTAGRFFARGQLVD
jgi:hypothetical protein